MRLEEEIKQSSFRSPQQKLTINLIYTYNWLISGQQALFKRYGLTMQQYNVLRILRGQFPDASPLTLIRERMLDRQSDVSRLLDRLVKKGLVSRKACREDRRKMDILITQAGLDLLEQMDAEVHRFETMMSSLREPEINVLNDLLDKLRG